MPSEAQLPIREVARLTGINPVTLRAWERRYGLIVPQRTAKGHRLYSRAQVERIQQILSWLARGVPVSQVRELLDGRPVAAAGDSPWQQQLDSFVSAVHGLAERRLEDQFSQSLALYPPATLYQHLLLPLLGQLRQHWRGQPGSALEQAFFCGWLRSRLASRLWHCRRQASGPLLLIASLDARRDSPLLWLCAWLLAEQGVQVEVLDEILPASELLLAVERLQPAALLLHGEDSIDSLWLRRQLPLLAQNRCRLLLTGAAWHIHQDQLDNLPPALEALQLRTALTDARTST